MQMLVGQDQADDAAARADQQRHLLDGDAVGRVDDVAFILAVVVIDDDHSFPLPKAVESAGDAFARRAEAGEKVVLTVNLIHGSHIH